MHGPAADTPAARTMCPTGGGKQLVLGVGFVFLVGLALVASGAMPT